MLAIPERTTVTVRPAMIPSPRHGKKESETMEEQMNVSKEA
jgi:hypothetical protein